MIEISVIIPVYLVEDYLSQCIDSVMNQTLENIEIILIDDCSPDRCPELCDQYALKDSRVSVIHKQINCGLSAARNSGINASKGEYICFVDSDDLLAPDYCRLLLSAVKSKGSRIAACKTKRFVNGNEINIDYISDTEITEISYDEYLKNQLTGKAEMGVWNRIYHRSIFKNIRFKDGVIHEDIFFAADLLTIKKLKIACIQTPLYFYRQRKTSIIGSHSSEKKCHPDRVKAGSYLLQSAKCNSFPHMNECFKYAIDYPWMFIDPIYAKFRFRQNKEFTCAVQELVKQYRKEYKALSLLNSTVRNRIVLFSYSKLLYGLNAYTRLARVYLFHLLKKDAYKDGHGI